IKNLDRLEKEMKALLSSLGEEPTLMEIRASASILHDFYSALEKIFEKIALIIDNNLPKGEKWHIELLSQMAKPSADIRPPVITENLFEKLKEYLKFRHLFRNIYGFELKWERIKPLVLSMSEVFDDFKKNIGKFLDYLESDKQFGK
ncbi:hypothetical protein DRJ04_09805, partial [Candidatus Aerophobetes bacterium]